MAQQKHTHAILLLFGVVITCVVQTVSRVAFDENHSAPLVRWCGMFLVLMGTLVFTVLWTWHIVFPHALKSIKMIWRVLLCFVPFIFPVVMAGFNAPILVLDEFDVSSSDAFKHWIIVFALLDIVVLFVIVPVLYIRSIRAARNIRVLKKMFALASTIIICGHVGLVFSFFGVLEVLSTLVFGSMLIWTIILILDWKETKSPQKDIASVYLLSIVVIGNPIGFGIGIVSIFTEVKQNPSLQFLVNIVFVCLFAF